MPPPDVPAGDEHGHAEGHLDELAAGRLGVVDEVGLGQHDDRLGAAVERQHQLALEPALVRGVAEGVGQEDDVDVGGQRVGLGAGALERRPPDERRPPRQDVVDPLAVVGRHDPVTDGDVGADVAHPSARWPDRSDRRRRGPCSSRGRDGRCVPAMPGAPSSLPRRVEARRPSPGAAARRSSTTASACHGVNGSRRRGPSASAVAASITDPLRARAAVRWRPMRRGMLTVPPAPGTRPRASSGRAMRVSGAAVDVAGERRHLDPRPHARPVQVDVQAVGEEVGEAGRAAGEAGDVGRRRVGERPELTEVAAAAERRAVAGQPHRRDGVVDGGQRERLGQPVAQRRR